MMHRSATRRRDELSVGHVPQALDYGPVAVHTVRICINQYLAAFVGRDMKSNTQRTLAQIQFLSKKTQGRNTFPKQDMALCV